MEQSVVGRCASERRVADTIRSLVNAKDLQLECARFLHETLLVSVLIYGRDNVMEEERSRVRACLVLGGWIES